MSSDIQVAEEQEPLPQPQRTTQEQGHKRTRRTRTRSTSSPPLPPYNSPPLPPTAPSNRTPNPTECITTVAEQVRKHCCHSAVSSVRVFIALIFLIGLGCSLGGGVVGVSGGGGGSLLTLSLLMIGVGVVLLTVSLIAFRLTSTPHSFPPFFPSHPHHSHHPPLEPPPRSPPPSYSQSMQEYRLRLLLYERSNFNFNNFPPPPYHHPRLMRNQRIIIHPYMPPLIPQPHHPYFNAFAQLPPPVHLSRPPSYRSRSSNTLDNEEVSPNVSPPLPAQSSSSSNNSNNNNNVAHARTPSQNSMEPITTTVVITTNYNNEEEDAKDTNMVTIVQSNGATQIGRREGHSVIVTVGNNDQFGTNFCTSCYSSSSCYCSSDVLAHI